MGNLDEVLFFTSRLVILVANECGLQSSCLFSFIHWARGGMNSLFVARTCICEWHAYTILFIFSFCGFHFIQLSIQKFPPTRDGMNLGKHSLWAIESKKWCTIIACAMCILQCCSSLWIDTNFRSNFRNSSKLRTVIATWLNNQVIEIRTTYLSWLARYLKRNKKESNRAFERSRSIGSGVLCILEYWKSYLWHTQYVMDINLI